MRKFFAAISITLAFITVTNLANASRSNFNVGFFLGVEEIELEIHVSTDVGFPLIGYSFDEEKVEVPIGLEKIRTIVSNTFKNQFSQYGVKVYRQDEKKDRGSAEENKVSNNDPEKDKLGVFDENGFNFSKKPPPKPRLNVHVYIVINSSEGVNGKKLTYGAITTQSFRKTGEPYPLATNLQGESFPVTFLVSDNKDIFEKILSESVIKVYDLQRRQMLCGKFEEIKCYRDLGEIYQEQMNKQ